MDDARAWALSYLAARGDAPYRWSDDGEVIAWTDETTIAFRTEIAFVLEWLIPHGWPPFGALVWLFAACRGKLPPKAQTRKSAPALHDPEVGGQMSLGTFAERLREMQSVVENGLFLIATLPETVRASPRAKAVLAETIFEGVEPVAGSQALRQAVVDVLRSGELTDRVLNLPGAPPAGGRSEFTALFEGLKTVTPEKLTLRLRTGLDELPKPATLPAIPAAQVKTMLADLRSDPEHQGLARVTRDFMAALQLPRRLAENDEMALGGFADLSNRGNLDRLLLSELAHDDLTLAVRIALQEALYLRREPPAKQPPSTLALLIDSGVRLWGVPRLLATAVSLAFIGKSAQHGKLAAFRAHGAGVVEVDLLTREGLTAHLAALETHAHPGEALPAFRTKLDEAGRVDAVLVTQRDVVQDPAFRRSLQAAQFESLYLAVVDRDGTFELLRYPQTSAPLCQAQVKVDDLFPAPPTTEPARAPLIDPALRLDLPLFFSVYPCPLLVPVRGKLQASVATAPGAGLCVLHDRRMFRWLNDTQGATIAAADLPAGATLWLGELPNGIAGVVKVDPDRRRLACRLFNPGGSLHGSYDWQLCGPAARAEAVGDLLYVIGTEARVYHMPSGDGLGQRTVHLRRSHGRYVWYPEGWRLLVWDGKALVLEPVHLPTAVPDQNILRVFNRRGHQGPWFVTRAGQVCNGEGKCVLELGAIGEHVTVSEDADRIIVVPLKVGRTTLVDLNTLRQRPLFSSLRAEEWAPPLQPPTRSVRTHFRSIVISPGRLQLVSKQGKLCEVSFKEDRLVLEEGEGGPCARPQPFVPVDDTARLGTSLGLATWADGRRAWLDQNGLLHLRAADRALPEVSLALHEGTPAVWSSDGLWYGLRFFIGAHSSSAPSMLWKHIEAITQ